jgi:hypothetical protein
VASTWELDTGVLRLSLTLSPEPYRGFSGEGAALAALATDDVADDADLISALLSWDPTIDVDALATAAGIDAGRVRAALARTGCCAFASPRSAPTSAPDTNPACSPPRRRPPVQSTRPRCTNGWPRSATGRRGRGT